MSKDEFLERAANILALEGIPEDLLFREILFWLREHFGEGQ